MPRTHAAATMDHGSVNCTKETASTIAKSNHVASKIQPTTQKIQIRPIFQTCLLIRAIKVPSACAVCAAVAVLASKVKDAESPVT